MDLFHCLQLAAAGGIFCHALHYLLESYLVRKIFDPIVQKYSILDTKNGVPNGANVAGETAPRRKLSDGDVAEISTKLVSEVYAIIVTAAGIIVMWQARGDVLYGRSSILKPFIPLIVWYFVYDLHAMFRSFCLRKNLTTKRLSARLRVFVTLKWVLIVHHLVLLTGALLEISGKLRQEGFADFSFGALLFRELSNPFVLMAQVLNTLNFQKSKVFKINGAAVIVSFFVCRILNTPVFILLCAWQYHALDVIATAKNMRLICYIIAILEMVLEVYWFFGILRLAFRTMRSDSSKSN